MLRNHRPTGGASMVGGARAAALTAAAGAMGLPAAALAARRRLRPAAQVHLGAAGARRLGHGVPGRRQGLLRDGRLGRTSGSATRSTRCENHVEQVNNAIAAKADVIVTSARERRAWSPPSSAAWPQGITMVIIDQGIEEEADELGLDIIDQDEFNAGILNGYPGGDLRPEADRQEGRRHRARQRQSRLDLDRQAPERQRARHQEVQRRPTAPPTPSRRYPDGELRRADRIDPEVDRPDRREGRRPGRGDRHRQSQRRSSRRCRSAA